MDFIVDTDISSMLAKTNNLDLLRKLFPKSKFFITIEIYNELLEAKESGYDYIDDILRQEFKILHMSPEIVDEYRKMSEALRNIHPGELQSILMCRTHNMVLMTNG